jgi:hypothetical protein
MKDCPHNERCDVEMCDFYTTRSAVVFQSVYHFILRMHSLLACDKLFQIPANPLFVKIYCNDRKRPYSFHRVGLQASLFVGTTKNKYDAGLSLLSTRAGIPKQLFERLLENSLNGRRSYDILSTLEDVH